MPDRLSQEDAFRIAMNYCCCRSPEDPRRVCQRSLGHEGWHSNAGKGPGDERVWTDEEAARCLLSHP